MRAKKVDTTHGEIRDHLRNAGWSVFDTSAVGQGFPDLMASRLGFTAGIECKSGPQTRAEFKLNEAQREFLRGWQGVYIVSTSGADAEKQLLLAMGYTGKPAQLARKAHKFK